MRRIGIDVGGTNTDAVLVEEIAVLGSYKTPTTSDVTTGNHQCAVRRPGAIPFGS